MISSSDIKYFLETAKAQHISRAAERLGITQPALSHSIKKIEDTVGLELFLRSKKGVTLTPAGKRLLEKAQGLEQSWSEVIDFVFETEEEVSGLVKIGCHTAVAQYTLPTFLPELLQKHPKLKIQLSHGLSRHVTEDVISDRLDLAISVNPIPHPDLVIKEIMRDQVTVFTTKNNLNENLIAYDPNLSQTQWILSKLGGLKSQFTRTLESTSLEVVAQLLNSGLGCAVLPERVAKALCPSATIVKAAPKLIDKICLVFKPTFRKTKKGQAIFEMLF